jgi:hypothetical protein
LPLELSGTKSQFLAQFPAFQPIAIGFEKWRSNCPYIKGTDVKRAYVCFASALEVDAFVSQMDGTVIGDNTIQVSKLEIPWNSLN